MTTGAGADGKTGVFVTGGMGFLGSHIAMTLLQHGHHVYLLARPQNGIPVHQRLRRLLDWFGVQTEERRRLYVWEGDLERPGLGLDTVYRNILKDEVEEIFHCASDTSFSERRRPEIEKANVYNLHNLLRIFTDSGCRRLHHVSTAYVAGNRVGWCPEIFKETDTFTNVYEETKYLGEKHLIEWCEKTNRLFHIYRPSIVYGHSKTGRSLRFNALYFPMRTLAFLKNIYERDINENQGRRADAVGVRMESDGRLHFPLRVDAARGKGLNLIPVDYFTEAVMAIRETVVEGNGIFHIVNSKQTTLEELLAFAQRFFRIQGMQIVSAEDFVQKPRNSLESLFERCLDAYRPYLKEERLFQDDNARKCLDDLHITCPPLDYDRFSRCMDYAVNADWGSRLFDATA